MWGIRLQKVPENQLTCNRSKEDSRASQVADQWILWHSCGRMAQVLPKTNRQLHMFALVTELMLLGRLDLRHASGRFGSCRSSSEEVEMKTHEPHLKIAGVV